jgi:hypothetical protein
MTPMNPLKIQSIGDSIFPPRSIKRQFPIINNLDLMASALLLGMTPLSALGQNPVISSLGQNGELICTNLQPATMASVEWAPSVTGPWSTNWAGLESLTVVSNGTIRVKVPMFYRVRGVAQITTPGAPEIEWVAPKNGIIEAFHYANGVLSGVTLFQGLKVLNGEGDISIDAHLLNDSLTKTSNTQAVKKNEQYNIALGLTFEASYLSTPGATCQSIVFSSPNFKSSKEVSIQSYTVMVTSPILPTRWEWRCPKTVTIGSISWDHDN